MYLPAVLTGNCTSEPASFNFVAGGGVVLGGPLMVQDQCNDMAGYSLAKPCTWTMVPASMSSNELGETGCMDRLQCGCVTPPVPADAPPEPALVEPPELDDPPEPLPGFPPAADPPEPDLPPDPAPVDPPEPGTLPPPEPLEASPPPASVVPASSPPVPVPSLLLLAEHP
jgi:hypothetical protein